MRIVEVGPRDGLQNEAVPIPTDVKVRFIGRLADAGLREIEATSFVSPKWVPQLADSGELWSALPAGPLYSALVPNARGLARAVERQVTRIAVFTAASDAFTQRNIAQTIEESLGTFAAVIASARESGVTFVRGYVSTAFECPYAGRVEPGRVVEVANRLLAIGCDEVSFGDTVGVATPSEVRSLIRALQTGFAGRSSQVAWHFHDTYGTAIANVETALGAGFSAFDASAGGLGGCPYAPGAGGNLATEDLVYLLEREGFGTGVDLDRLARASEEILAVLGRRPESKVQRALWAADTRRCST